MNKNFIVLCAVIIGAVAFLFIVNLIFSLLYPVKYLHEIKYSCNKFNVEIPLVLSVINAESSFNEKAVSSAGAQGLMQLMPATAEYIAEKISYPDKIDLFEAKCNIHLGVAYLSYLFQRFSDFDTAICAYNAGESEVKTWDRDDSGQLVVKFEETKKYLTNVKKSMQIYAKKSF